MKLNFLLGVCSKDHKNLVIVDRADADEADINAVKRMAKSFGAYFNQIPQCYICKEPLSGDDAQTFEIKDDASREAAAKAMSEILKGK